MTYRDTSPNHWLTAEELARARKHMKLGRSLYTIAADLGVFSWELDLALWRDIGKPKQPEPMW